MKRIAKILYFLSGIVVGAIISRGIINSDQTGSVRYSTNSTGETKSYVLTNLNNLNSLGLYDFGEGLTHISHFNDIESPIFTTFVGNNKGSVILNGGFNVKYKTEDSFTSVLTFFNDSGRSYNLKIKLQPQTGNKPNPTTPPPEKQRGQQLSLE